MTIGGFAELDEFLQDLDEDVEGMQSTIYYLQQELRKAKDELASLQLETDQLKTGPEEAAAEKETTPEVPALEDTKVAFVCREHAILMHSHEISLHSAFSSMGPSDLV